MGTNDDPPTLEYEAKRARRTLDTTTTTAAAGFVWAVTAVISVFALVIGINRASDIADRLLVLFTLAAAAMVAWIEWRALRHRSRRAALAIAVFFSLVGVLLACPSILVFGAVAGTAFRNVGSSAGGAEAAFYVMVAVSPFACLFVAFEHFDWAGRLLREERQNRRLAEEFRGTI